MAFDPTYAGAKFVHVLLAASWLGLMLVHAMVVAPLLRSSTPTTRREFAGRFLPAAVRTGNILGGLTLLSGLLLTYVVAGNLRFQGDWGRYVAFALVVNLAVIYLLNIVIGRSWRAVQKAMEREPVDVPPPMRVQFMERRIAANVWLSLLLLAIAAFMMVLAAATRTG